MKILVIANRYPNSDKPYAGKFVQRHVALHRQMGLTVHVCAPKTQQTWQYLGLLWQMIIYLSQNDPDLIHGHWELPSGLLAILAGKWKRCPVIITSHGAYTENFEQRPYIVQKLIRWVLQQANELVVVGRAQREKVTRISGRTAMHWVHMGAWLPEIPLTKVQARAHLKLHPSELTIIYIGNLFPYKGPDILIQALGILRKQVGKTFQVYVGGVGASLVSLKAMVQELELTELVVFLGAVEPDDVPIWLSAGDICVVPSRREPFGLVAIEAMGARTAVVASDVGDLSRNIQDGVNGYLVPSEDPQTLADKLQHLLENPRLREGVLEAGWHTAQQNHMSQQAQTIADLYHQTRENK